ncbi:hypothetical protein Q7P35_002321 [Cladosporium inversicolor]
MATEKLSSKSRTTNINCSFDEEDAVTLHVGPTEHAILSHGNFISRRSEVFKGALMKELAEGQTRVIKLPDEDPPVITHYLSYTYSKYLPTDIFTTDFMGTFPEESDEYSQLLSELYVLGERLLSETIRSNLITEIIRLAKLKDKDSQRHFPMKEAVNIIYHGTTAGSPARRLMVDIRVSHATTKWSDSTYEAAFVLDVTQNLYAKFDKHNFVSNFRDDTLKASDYLS